MKPVGLHSLACSFFNGLVRKSTEASFPLRKKKIQEGLMAQRSGKDRLQKFQISKKTISAKKVWNNSSCFMMPIEWWKHSVFYWSLWSKETWNISTWLLDFRLNRFAKNISFSLRDTLAMKIWNNFCCILSPIFWKNLFKKKTLKCFQFRRAISFAKCSIFAIQAIQV